jgi:hypothetical protein
MKPIQLLELMKRELIFAVVFFDSCASTIDLKEYNLDTTWGLPAFEIPWKLLDPP